ncbi:MAG: DUF4235 domain-containing protein [Ilumatobacteraceae bacterium]
MKLRRVPTTIGRERIWKLESWITGAVGAFVAQVLIRAIYRMIRKDKAPSAVFDSANSRFSWPDAAVWAVAGGLGLAIAKIVSSRIAAIGWEVATGTLPPGAEEQTVG